MKHSSPLLGVVIPTRNCLGPLPAHLLSVAVWSKLASEIVVVDSFSDDGTTAYLKKHLHHPHLRIISHPPGLYDSWNCGIQQLQSKYAYISTVGDSISATGLKALLTAAERLDSDAIVSQPVFLNTQNEVVADLAWPIRDLIQLLEINQPIWLEPAQLFFAALKYSLDTHAVLGSSAGNLYRTDCLKRRPFPTSYGRAGDTAWGIMNAWKVKLAMMPETWSTFLVHPKADGDDRDEVDEVRLKLLKLVNVTLETELQETELPVLLRQDLIRARHLISGLEKVLEQTDYRLQKSKLAAYRKRMIPWMVFPTAWRARMGRNQHRRVMERLRNEIDQLSARYLKSQPFDGPSRAVQTCLGAFSK